jgi:hypothetical protein
MPVGTAGSRGARPPMYLDHRCSCFNLRAGPLTKVPFAIAVDEVREPRPIARRLLLRHRNARVVSAFAVRPLLVLSERERRNADALALSPTGSELDSPIGHLRVTAGPGPRSRR